MARVKMPNACSQYGADMGRMSYRADDSEAPRKFTLRLLGLDSGGYDSGGAYWGTPNNVYIAEDDNSDANEHGVVRHFIRADDREDAKCQMILMYPRASFYR